MRVGKESRDKRDLVLEVETRRENCNSNGGKINLRRYLKTQKVKVFNNV